MDKETYEAIIEMQQKTIDKLFEANDKMYAFMLQQKKSSPVAPDDDLDMKEKVLKLQADMTAVKNGLYPQIDSKALVARITSDHHQRGV